MRIATLVLAAGRGTRFGAEPKQLAPFTQCVIRDTAKAASQEPFDDDRIS